MAALNPCPTSPSTCWSVSFTSSKWTVVVLEARMPILSSCGPAVTPGRSRGTMKAVMWALPSPLPEGVLAKTV